MDTGSVKVCPTCSTSKLLNEFYRSKLNVISSECKECNKARSRLRYRQFTDEEKANYKRQTRMATMKRYHSDEEFRHKMLAQNRVYQKESGFNRRKQLRIKYNMTVEEYDALLEKQNGVCAICQEACTTGRRLAVDHCHETGKIRGLLCTKCNNGLGSFRDSVKLLYRASDYLEETRVNFS